MLRKIVFHNKVQEAVQMNWMMLEVDTPQMLVNGLKALVPGFSEYTREHPDIVILAEAPETGEKKWIENANLKTDFKDSTTIHVVDNIEGNFDPITIGVALGFAGTTAFIVGVVVNVAISMVLGTVAAALAPKPNTNNGSSPSSNKPSFIFNQPVNTMSQGGAVPIAYGTCLVGSTVIAADLLTIDIPVKS